MLVSHKLDGYMALHVRTGSGAPSERVGASPGVDQLFYSVRDKLGLAEYKPDPNTLQTALQCLQDNNFKSTAAQGIVGQPVDYKVNSSTSQGI